MDKRLGIFNVGAQSNLNLAHLTAWTIFHQFSMFQRVRIMRLGLVVVERWNFIWSTTTTLESPEVLPSVPLTLHESKLTPVTQRQKIQLSNRCLENRENQTEKSMNPRLGRSSPEEIRTLVKGSRGPYAWPLHHRAPDWSKRLPRFHVIRLNVSLVTVLLT